MVKISQKQSDAIFMCCPAPDLGSSLDVVCSSVLRFVDDSSEENLDEDCAMMIEEEEGKEMIINK